MLSVNVGHFSSPTKLSNHASLAVQYLIMVIQNSQLPLYVKPPGPPPSDSCSYINLAFNSGKNVACEHNPGSCFFANAAPLGTQFSGILM